MNCFLFVLLALLTISAQAQPDVLINRYNANVTGANTHEIVLNTSNVNPDHFGKLYSYYVDGAVYAQPLYVSSLRIARGRPLDAIFVATMNDRVYAFDASRQGPPLWRRDLTNEMNGVTPVPVADVTNNPELNIVGNVGIEGTPVIDLATGALFLVARTKENGGYVQRLHKLDIHTGADIVAPVVIEAAVKSSAKDAVAGVLRFDPKGGNQRSALVLVDGKVVIAWASHEDIRPYHGWIMAYDADSLTQTGTLCLSPDGAEGGVWQSGRPPAVDSEGNVYFEVGNGSWNGERDFGNSLLKIRIGANDISVADFFTPHDWGALNERDADLGSTGPLLVPGTNVVIAGSKSGTIYLLNKDRLGHLTATNSGVIQRMDIEGGRPLAGPSFWDGPSGGTFYLWCDADVLEAFRFDGKLLVAQPFAKGAVVSKGSPGGALTVSADDKKHGSGIVWATLTNGKNADHGNAAGILRAYDAETLKELWNSEQQRRRDRLGTLVKFVPPLVVAGKVYVPNYDNSVNVYGLLPSQQ
ncbi:MAG TPA: hypothetical protein VKB88_23535 [Bryobacteraceae bacterium]|nr:hypothetical protein [Bryobacteraceae bacterium]